MKHLETKKKVAMYTDKHPEALPLLLLNELSGQHGNASDSSALNRAGACVVVLPHGDLATGPAIAVQLVVQADVARTVVQSFSDFGARRCLTPIS